MKFGIIGTGLIGQKRAESIRELGHEVVSAFDASPERASTLAEKFGARVFPSAEELFVRSGADAVVIATFHDALPSFATAALRAGKHVLLEKPGAARLPDLEALAKEAAQAKGVLRVGFNHRFHPALQRAKALVASHEFGPLLYIRAKYGHGGRLGYEKEWRADPKISGGGELIDQGSHLIDLTRWIGGSDMLLEWGKAENHFWPMPVDDNAFLFLKSTDGKRSAMLHASCTEWKNLFHFEIFCQTAKIEITGLGRSYGLEELKVWRMKPEMGPPDLETFSYPGPDTSWREEMRAFLAAIHNEPSEQATLNDALASLTIVAETYRRSAIFAR